MRQPVALSHRPYSLCARVTLSSARACADAAVFVVFMMFVMFRARFFCTTRVFGARSGGVCALAPTPRQSRALDPSAQALSLWWHRARGFCDGAISTEVQHPRFVFRDRGRPAGLCWSHPGAVTKVFTLRNTSRRAAGRPRCGHGSAG